MKHPLLLLLFLLSIGMLQAQQISSKTIEVKPYMSHQNYEHFKRLVLVSDDSHAEYIEGFEFEWGYEYTLRVQEKKLGSTYSDGTQYLYALEKIVSKTKVPDSIEFRLQVDPWRYYFEEEDPDLNYTFSIVDDSTYFYMEEVFIEVPDHLRDTFAALVAGTIGWNGHYTFVDSKRIRLVALF